MRKYLKFAVISMVITLSLGAFYVNAAMSKGQYPEFYIKTQSGDTQEVKPLVIEGYYNSSRYDGSKNLKITKEGSTYNSRSFVNELLREPPLVMKELQENHRTFMRAKNNWVNLFFEDSQYLAYANVDDNMNSLGSSEFAFNISVLNKKQGNENSFTVDVPKSEDLIHVYIEDVQMKNDQLYVITQNIGRKNNEKNIYTIDMDNRKISHHEAIISISKNQDNSYSHVSFMGTSPIEGNEQLILIHSEEKHNVEKESTRAEVESTRVEERSKKIISYNIVTKEKEKVNVPDLFLKEHQLSFFDGSTIYFTKLDGEELIVTPYSLREGTVEKPFSVQLSSETGIKGNMDGPLVIVKDNKLYAASPTINSKVNGDVVVADVKTGETLFKGQIALKHSSELESQFRLNLHEIFVK